MKMIKVATVFSGIGSFEFALKRLGIEHEIMFACDNGEREIQYDEVAEKKHVFSLKTIDDKQEYVEDLYAKITRKRNWMKQSYLGNYNCSPKRFFEDIRLLDGNDFKGKVDILVGGSPCQSFSSVGFQGGLSDARGTLFYEFARLVKEVQPKVFIYENVRNLINHDKGNTWKVIQSIFNSLGYQYDYAILNAADYGIPQTRRRLFVIGFKDQAAKFEMPKTKARKFKLQDFLIDNCAFGNFTFSKNGAIKLFKEPGQVERKYYLTPALYRYVMKGGTKSFYQKPVINLEVARTLLKTMGNRHRAGIDNYVSDDGSTDFGKVRMLTERECLRLMGFTDDFNICVSSSQIYKQAGNSIVVDVMMEIIKQIRKTGFLEE